MMCPGELTPVYLTDDEIKIVADACERYQGIVAKIKTELDRRVNDRSVLTAQDVASGLRAELKRRKEAKE